MMCCRQVCCCCVAAARRCWASSCRRRQPCSSSKSIHARCRCWWWPALAPRGPARTTKTTGCRDAGFRMPTGRSRGLRRAPASAGWRCPCPRCRHAPSAPRRVSRSQTWRSRGRDSPGSARNGRASAQIGGGGQATGAARRECRPRVWSSAAAARNVKVHGNARKWATTARDAAAHWQAGRDEGPLEPPRNRSRPVEDAARNGV